jgi:hypothetical protein
MEMGEVEFLGGSRCCFYKELVFTVRITSLAIQNAEIVTFVNIDNIAGSNYETYQLASITLAST